MDLLQASQRQRLEQGRHACNFHDEPTAARPVKRSRPKLRSSVRASTVARLDVFRGVVALKASVAWHRQPQTARIQARARSASQPAQDAQVWQHSVTRIDRVGIVVDTAKPGLLPVELAARLANRRGLTVTGGDPRGRRGVHARLAVRAIVSQICPHARYCIAPTRVTGHLGMNGILSDGGSLSKSRGSRPRTGPQTTSPDAMAAVCKCHGINLIINGASSANLTFQPGCVQGSDG